jgi:Uma2 family endonuclease
MTTKTQSSQRLYRSRRRGWTRQEYERLTEIGFFGPDERLELIQGEIVKKMPQNSPHATAITLTMDVLRPILPDDHHLRSQLPLAVSDLSEPEPDVAVVAGTARDYRNAHPMTAALIVEVSDTTLNADRVTKAAIYARALIPEYWIININDRQLEVHRQPGPMRSHRLGHYYYVVTWYDETQTVAPLFAPQAALAVRDLLP